MAQISGRKLRGTPSEPIVNLGGEFSRLAEEEGTHKAQLARVHAELAEGEVRAAAGGHGEPGEPEGAAEEDPAVNFEEGAGGERRQRVIFYD